MVTIADRVLPDNTGHYASSVIRCMPCKSFCGDNSESSCF